MRHGYVLRKERTEYGKRVRKAYEGGAAYDPAMRQYMPRPDGLSNTITTVQKDNLLLEMEEDEILSAH